MRPRTRHLALACLGVAPACQAPQTATSSFTTDVVLTSATETSDTDASSSASSGPSPESTTTTESTASSTPADSSGDPGPILDVGTKQDAGTGAPAGCKGKIDFLFVIGRYGVMQYFQQQLLAAFPAFIATIEDKFADFDYHIMLVDADAWWGKKNCNEQCEEQCPPEYPCDYTPTTCDNLMGTGMVFPAGDLATNKPCKIADDRRYMVKGQPDLKETFTCVATMGTSGENRMADALTAAIDHNLNGPGGCNGGFLRKDALLMVTLLTANYDEPQNPFGSKGTPEAWHSAVLAAKGDDPEAVVVLNIQDSEYAPGCHPKDRICQMTRMFPYSWVADINDKEYGSAFAAAAAMVETACEAFVPPS